MGKINVLQPNVFNMLAAGEVVENPSSVVKELVENSIDAGAHEISIAVEQGGIRKIQVSDDGAGILREDMRAAFIPHATSKISEIGDLDTLATLGFRGEALASIASVSEVTLISRSKFREEAAKIVLRGGEVIQESVDSRAQGTIVTVENLFFNTPARLKFLKKPASELRQILDVVRMLVLANPNVSFTLSNEDGELLYHDGGVLKDSVCSVYGVKALDNLIEIYHEQGNASVHGFISKVDYTKPNRTYQSIIINGRAVEDSMIQTAVEKAYGDYLMKRAYPMFAINVLLPFDEVDVNVHPRKTEVRFFDKHQVFSLVYHAVKEAIEASMGKSTLGFDISDEKETEVAPTVSAVQTKMDMSSLYGNPAKVAPHDYSYASSNGFRESALDFGDLKQANEEQAWHNEDNLDDLQHVQNIYVKSAFETDYENSDLNLTEVAADDLKNDEIETSQIQDNSYGQISVFDGKIVGQVFATYLLVERDEMLYVIDQHAAHERILYDKIVEECEAQYSQPLLIPYKLSLTGSEEEYIERILPTLNSLGFEIEHNGYVYLVKAVPQAVSNMNFSKFFGELFANMLNENEITLAELIKEKLCQQACKAAIKGGEVLSREQIEHVIKSYVDEDGNLPAKCPHGRPAVIALQKRDFEKMFKRIV